MIYTGLADAVVVLHFAFLAFVAFGGFLAWRWRWVVWPHLAAVAAAFVSITIHYDCPLTNLEIALRKRAHSGVYRHGFVDHYIKGHLYPTGYDWIVQAVIAALIVISYVPIVTSYVSSKSRPPAARPPSLPHGAGPSPR
jgi:hypothetical protein